MIFFDLSIILTIYIYLFKFNLLLLNGANCNSIVLSFYLIDVKSLLLNGAYYYKDLICFLIGVLSNLFKMYTST
jgi:hypothetical protein